MNSNQRTFLALILILGVFIVFQYLTPKPAPQISPMPQAPAEEAAPPAEAVAEKVPAAAVGLKGTGPATSAPVVQNILETGDFRAVLTSQGASLEEYHLKGFKLPDGRQVQLIPEDGRALTMAITLDGKQLDLSRHNFTVVGEERNSVTYRLELGGGLAVTKRYTALEGRMGLALAVEMDNAGRAELGPRYDLIWDCGMNFTEKDRKIDDNEYAAVLLLDKKLESDKAKKLAKPDIEQIEGSVTFSGVRTKYFAAVMVPVERPAAAARQGLNGDRISTRLSLKAGQPDSFAIYLGPIHHRMLSAVYPQLDLVADTGWKPLQPVTRAILWLLLFLHSLIPNYGVVIIVFSVIIKLAFFPLSYKGMKSMRRMQQLQPKMKKIQEQHKNDPGKMNQETMALYKKHGVNPLGGCLPLLLQMPVFFALYSVLANTIELRQAPFIFWIHDLAAKDPYYVLSALMGIAMFFQQKMTTVDPKQKFMIYLMPLFMVFIFSSLPAGLNLYWLVYNILSIGEQYLIHIRHKPIED
jgi:YidC/Oxa1 family membrane protein insertase